MITRAVFGILIPILLVLIGVMGAIVVAVVLFAVHPALALVPVAALVLAAVVFARWEQRDVRPPDGLR